MLPIERRNEILQTLMQKGKVVVSELAEQYEVTEETIRRDLEKLEADGFVTKTYGGAVPKQNSALDLPYNVRESVNVVQKQLIASKICEMIHDGDRVMLDSSSTALYVLKKLKDKKNLTVITNSVKILIELADKSDWKVLSTGGMLKRSALSLTGSSAEKMIGTYHVDVAICSCRGVDMDFGVTDSNENDGQLKRAMFAAADRRILALDTEKFDHKAFVRVCGFREIDVIVTDSEPQEKWIGFCNEQNIKLVY